MAPPIGPSGCPYRVPSKNTIVSDSRRANWCCNSPAWYSLRLNSRPSELPSIKSTNYEKSQLFGRACVYGQVIKTRRNDRVVRVERRAVIGAGRLKQALRNSENSVMLNTSFVERLNLTIRQDSSYLGRQTLCQARGKQHLDAHLELLRCHYNFVRGSQNTGPTGWVDQ